MRLSQQETSIKRGMLQREEETRMRRRARVRGMPLRQPNAARVRHKPLQFPSMPPAAHAEHLPETPRSLTSHRRAPSLLDRIRAALARFK